MNVRFRYVLPLLAVALVWASDALLADTLIYRSGRKVEGKMIHINGFRVLFRLKNGKEIAVPASRIKRVVFGKGRRKPAEEIPKPPVPEKRPEPPGRKEIRPAPLREENRKEARKEARKEPRKEIRKDVRPAPEPRARPQRRPTPGPKRSQTIRKTERRDPEAGSGRKAPELFRGSDAKRSAAIQGPDRILYAARPVRVTLAPERAGDAGTIYYSINDGARVRYAAPFVLSRTGFYHIRYFAVDPAGNREMLRHKKIYVDRAEPGISVDFQGSHWTDHRGVTFVSSPFVFLRAFDPHTGVSAFRCRLGEEILELSPDGGVIALGEAGKTRELTCEARDRVGNRGRLTTYLHHDQGGPRLTWRSPDVARAMKSDARIAFNVEDGQSGIASLRLLVDDQVHFLPADARSFAPADYESESGAERTFVLIAVDRAGNETRSEPMRLRIDKKPPVSELKFAE